MMTFIGEKKLGTLSYIHNVRSVLLKGLKKDSEQGTFQEKIIYINILIKNMEENKKKLSVNDTITRMIRSVNANNISDFYKIVEQYAETFVYNSNTRYTLLSLVRQRPIQLRSLDELSNDIKKLIIKNELKDENVFLNDQTNKLIEELLLEWKNISVYQYHNLKVRNKILLHGITGNGKTTIARYISKKSELPFIQIKSDEVIDSHLGSTGSNIYKIFNDIKEPCIIFWDEVDSIGCKRGSTDNSSASTENDRITNSVLLNIERLKDDVIFIGATNRKDVLDSAFIRRFDVSFEITPPKDIEKINFAEQLIDYYKIPIKSPNLSKLNSYSEIKNIIVEIARTHILNLIKTPIEPQLN